jgi:hypothetical protein
MLNGTPITSLLERLLEVLGLGESLDGGRIMPSQLV